MEQEIVQALRKRIEHLERRQYLLSALLLLILISATAGVMLQPGSAAQQPAPAILRAHAIIIVDDRGRERIIMGSPVPDPREGKRRTASAGLVVNDASGNERFGFGLGEDGRMIM